MKLKYCFLVLMMSFGANSFCQFQPSQNGNYYDDLSYWSNYYDSIIQYQITNNIDEKIQGYSSFQRWRNYWELFMPSSGSYSEALEIIKLNQEQLKKDHFNQIINSSNGNNALIVPPVQWEELGPKNMTKIKTEDITNDGVWLDSHINNDGTNPPWNNNGGNLQSGAHVGKIDRLYQHPTVPEIIFACAGGIENGGGGLFVSYDSGYNWTVLGTDAIPNPLISSFAIKPYNVSPQPTKEYLFIGLSTGAAYRSENSGLTWIECNYNGSNSYPFYAGTSEPWFSTDVPNSLPFDNVSQNFSFSSTEKINDIKLAKSSTSSSDYSRVVVARSEGLYYSDNFFNNLTATGNGTITNDIVWQEFNFDIIGGQPILNAIPLLDPLTTDRVLHFTDFESFVKNGSTNYVAHFQIAELFFDGVGNPPYDTLGPIRQYVCVSTDFGSTWNFLGNITDVNSANNEELDLDQRFSVGNIEVNKVEPNYVYIANAKLDTNLVTFPYTLKRFNLNTSSWEDFSSSLFSPVNIVPHGFAIDPSNDLNWWFVNNGMHKTYGGTFSAPSMGYSTKHHADARDLLVLPNGKLMIATDGGINQSTIGATDYIFNATSEGLNTAQSNGIGLAQSPPFYVAASFWHSGLQVYNPDTDEWHWGSISDGQTGDMFFLNNERFSLTNQWYNGSIIKDYDFFNSATGSGGGEVSGSENITGRVYGIRRMNSLDNLAYNLDDFTATSSWTLTGQTFPYQVTVPKVVPNEPDLLTLNYRIGSAFFIEIYNGCASATPVPVLQKTLDINNIYDPTNIEGGNLGEYVFDPRRNGKMWIVLKTNPVWSSYHQNRIVEYDLNTDTYIDLSFPTDDNHTSSAYFPNWLNITSLELDRQTGVLYLGTTNGVYYLDRDNEMWRKYSVNVPLFSTKIDIRHCTGEIYVSSTNRGIWYTNTIRDTQTPTLEWVINTSQTWNERMNLFCTLIIESGVTLYVNDGIVIYGNQRIIVKPGGKLILNNATITTECGDFWKGIEIWGQTNQPQLFQHQGALIMNNSTIENAREAVRLWEPNNWNSPGGIIRATNSNFVNNILDVEFIPYDWELNGVPQPNRGEFNNCTFTKDDNFLANGYFAHVTLYKVYGVNFFSCDFADNRDVPLSQKGRGILSIDAKYKVLGKSIGTSPTAIEYYDDVLYDPGTFYNLKSGVEAMNANSQNTITVDQCSFTDCNYGVRLSLVNDALLTRNKFDRTNGTNSGWFQFQYDIFTDNSTAYKIEGNEFTSQTGLFSLGVTILNSGLQDNEVYKNRMTNVSFGAFSAGKNRNDAFGFGYEGLEFLCNENTNNGLMDIAISVNGILEGAKLEQGLFSESTGNTFSPLNAPNNYNIFSNLPASIYTRYFYYNGLNEEPLNNSINVDEIESPISNQCLSNFNVVIPGPGKPVPSPPDVLLLKSNFDSLSTNYSMKRVALTALETNGNRIELHNAVDNINWWSLYPTYTLIHGEAPYLSEEILIKLGEKTPWEFPHYLLKHLIIENIELARNPEFMDFLRTKQFPLPYWYLHQIEDAASTQTTERGIKQSELVGINREKNRNANLIIKNIVQDSLGVDVTQYNEWVIKRGDVLCELQLIDNYLDKGQKTNCSLRMAILDGQISQLTAGRLKTELQDYRAFKNEMLALTKANGELQGLDTLSESVVRYYAENATGYAKNQAQNLLCFWLGECTEAPTPPGGPSNSAIMLQNTDEETITEKALVNLFAMYPNPTDEQVTIELTELRLDSKIKIIDINGRVVFESVARNIKTTIDVSSYQRGVYIVLVQNADSLIEREKLIIQ